MTHKSMTQPVTASPSWRHLEGSASLSLHSMYALLTFEHLIATCLDMDMSMADVGGAEESAMANDPRLRLLNKLKCAFCQY